MKKIYRVLFSVTVLMACMLMFAACNKDFLDKNPLDQVSSGTFWKTDADAQLALAGCYRTLQSGFLGYQRIWLDCLSDNAFAEYNYFNMGSMTIGVISPTSGGAISTLYNSSYAGIASCNYFLGNIDKVPISDDSKKRYIGEVKFLRALMYFDLVQSFGDVILYKESPKSADDAKIAKSPKADVLAFINQDLDDAIASLPDDPYVGHAVKGSAEAIKTRVLMYQEKWADAAAMAQQIISSGKFSIADDYLGLFLTATQLNNPEIMFSTEYLGPDDPTATVESMDVKLGWYSAIQPYQNLVDEYECKDGKSIQESPLYDPAHPYDNRDPRLVLTMKIPGEVWPDPQTPPETGYVMRKYVDFSHAPFSYAKANLSDQDMVWVRYADVLLMYAEAKNEASGPDASIYTAINQVRSRKGVNMPPVDQTKYNTQSSLREYIRHERRVELALEGQRYFDLKRWHIAEVKIPQVKNPAGIQLVFDPKFYLLPFQQSELDNNPQLEQNPGYN